LLRGRNPAPAVAALRAARRRPGVHGHAGRRRSAVAWRCMEGRDRWLPRSFGQHFRLIRERDAWCRLSNAGLMHMPPIRHPQTRSPQQESFMGMMQEFKEFAMRGNVIDLAVGVVIGGAFGKIVAALVDKIIMPPIGL